MSVRLANPFGPSANERFKASASRWTSVGIIAATLLHASVFALFPGLEAADVPVADDGVLVVPLPSETVVPPPPERVTRPAVPRPASLPGDVTVDVVPWEPPVGLVPPPSGSAGAAPAWTPRDVEPRLRNVEAIRAELRRRYPAQLRDAGIGGTVVLDVFVDSDGRPGDVRVREGSGYAVFDSVARRLVPDMEFAPALNRDRPVAVWIRQPVVFTPRR